MSYAATEPLSVVLRRATRLRHDASDEFVRSYAPLAFAHPRVWCALLEQYRLIFAAFEEALHEEPKELSALLPVYRSLSRSSAFEADICFFRARAGEAVGDGRVEPTTPVPAMEEWRSRVSEIARTDPLLLISHVHTMYSAILSGGRIIRSMQRRAMGLSKEEGGAIFAFHSAHVDLKESLRVALDSLEVGPEYCEKLTKEKGDIFRRSDMVIEQTVTSVPESKRPVLYAYLRKRVLRSPSALLVIFVLVAVIALLLRAIINLLL